MKTILVPLDGSALADRVLPYVRMLAPIMDAKIDLLQIVSAIDADSSFSDAIAGLYSVSEPPVAIDERRRQAVELIRQHAEGHLAAHAAQLRESGRVADFDVRIGPPAEIIVEIAATRSPALIAMATHGYGGLRRWALGSVTDKVVHAATAPIFVVRGDGPLSTPEPTLKRIMAPLDGSAFARQALPLAVELAQRANAELVLLHAMTPLVHVYPWLRSTGQSMTPFTDVMTVLREEATNELNALADELRPLGVSVTTVVTMGHAAEAIVDTAAQRAIDLIVMATHGYGGLKRWALGSVADKVLHAASTPLILVRAELNEYGILPKLERGIWGEATIEGPLPTFK